MTGSAGGGHAIAPSAAPAARAVGRPRLLLIDLDDWDSFASLAPALRRRGMAVARVSRRPAGVAGLVSTVLDRLVFGRPGALLGPDDELVASLPRELLAPPTADVQGTEVDAEALRAAGAWPQAPVALRVPDPDAAPLLYDKYAMTRFAEAVPVAVPRSWQEAPADVFPLVVKGKVGSGGLSVRVVSDEAALVAAVAELDPSSEGTVFFQEFDEGHLTVFGGIARDGELLAGAAYRARAAADDPYGPAAGLEVVASAGIDANLPPLLRALRYTGFFCVDYIERSDGSAAMIDFNPRVFAGWLALQVAGVDLLSAYLSLFGLSAPPARASTPTGRTGEVRIVPRAGAASWAALRSDVVRAGRAVQAALPVAGTRFALAAAVRTGYVSARSALSLVRR